MQSKLNEISKATLALIPRAVKTAALVGQNAAQIGMEYSHLSPNCQQTRFPNTRRFLQFTEDKTKTSWDAIIVTGQIAQFTETSQLLAKFIKVLDTAGVLIFECRNPYHFKQLEQKLNLSSNPDPNLIQAILAKAENYSKKITAAFKASGYEIDRLVRVKDNRSQEWINSSGLREALPDKIYQRLTKVCSSLAFLFRLTPIKHPQFRIQAKILQPVGGVNDVRVNFPLAALQTIPGVQIHISQNQSIKAVKQQGIEKVFLWQRPVMTFEHSVPVIQQLRAAGYLIIVEFDDHTSPWPAIEENNYLTFAGAHAVQTTNQSMANFIRNHNPEVGIFPNQLHHFPSRDLTVPAEAAGIFFGALNRKEDYKTLLPCINGALNELKERFHFHVVGDEYFFENLRTDHKSFHPRGSYQEYLNVLIKADIALMPLADTEFNRLKSDLKMVEAAGCGAVPIASAVVYEQTDLQRDFSEICSEDNEFVSALIKLVNNPDIRLEKQKKGREYVQSNRMLSDHCQSRYQWLSNLITRRNELDQALASRLQKILPNDCINR
ncbi:glycosyltransferase family protein [Sneathiella glossodoripedis]|uniref:glycosyltransferase family protein n=1 Tax=Sneathiella glossodoripedis TaxID=418853 RepID=UPI0011DE2675|nr:glycosyltransferase [Sneathiella glossodoripedis]